MRSELYQGRIQFQFAKNGLNHEIEMAKSRPINTFAEHDLVQLLSGEEVFGTCYAFYAEHCAQPLQCPYVDPEQI